VRTPIPRGEGRRRSLPVIVAPLDGWVFAGFPDERLLSMIRPGTGRLWDDARTMGKRPGEPVLFLQLGPRGAAWVGSGTVSGLEERWKAFGVHVTTRRVLPRPLPAIATESATRDAGLRQAQVSIRTRGIAAWENRTLAARIGLAEFRLRTPYLEESRDTRLSASDWGLLCELQPRLADLRPEA